jgi:transposase
VDQRNASAPGLTIGLDLSDRHAQICVMSAGGEIEERSRVALKPEILRRRFGGAPPARIALEVGMHSPWVSRLLAECGHEVLVANPRNLRKRPEER